MVLHRRKAFLDNHQTMYQISRLIKNKASSDQGSIVAAAARLGGGKFAELAIGYVLNFGNGNNDPAWAWIAFRRIPGIFCYSEI